MAMTTEEALAFVENMHTDTVTEQNSSDGETHKQESENDNEVPPVVEKDSSTHQTKQTEETSKLVSNPSVQKDDPNADKVSYAFAKEKAKRKEMKKHYEEQISALKQQLKERLEAKPNDDDISGLVDYKVEQERIKDSIANAENNMRDLDADELQAENDRRIANAWNDEAKRSEYKSLLESNGAMFLDALKKYDPENVVLEYLDGQQDYPLLLKELMTNAESLKTVFVHKDTMGRLMALDMLNRKLHSIRPSVAKIGRLVRNGANTVSSTKKDNNYWNNWLKNHPRH